MHSIKAYSSTELVSSLIDFKAAMLLAYIFMWFLQWEQEWWTGHLTAHVYNINHLLPHPQLMKIMHNIFYNHRILWSICDYENHIEQSIQLIYKLITILKF